MATKPKLHIDK